MAKPPITRAGSIMVICGCMFSGKSTAAGQIADQERHSKIRQSQSFVPDKARRDVTLNTGEIVDTKDRLVSRNGSISPAIEFAWNRPWDLLSHLDPLTTTVIIEEAHFCTQELVEVCCHLAEQLELRVVVTGLDQTFSSEGFGPMPALMVEADDVRKCLAVCTECGSLSASKSWLDPSALQEVQDGRILVGDTQYKAVCRHCYRELVQRHGLVRF